MPQSLNEALRAAYAEHESPSDTASDSVDIAGALDTKADEVEISSEKPSESAVETDVKEKAESEQTTEVESAPETSDTSAEETKEAEEKPSEKPDTSEDSTPAPVAWRGVAKQHWGELPQEVQQEVLRREKEVVDVLQESASARKMADNFQAVIEPFVPILQAEQIDPLTATASLFQTASQLRHGSMEQKVGILYSLIQQHGIDVSMLDSMLVGETPAPAAAQALPPEVQQAIDARMKPYEQLLETVDHARRVQTEVSDAEADTEAEEFSRDPRHIFMADVADDMITLLESADRVGREMSLEQAYRAAISMNPELSKLQAEREKALRVSNGSTAAERRQHAARTLRPTSVPVAGTEKPQDRESQLLQAWDYHSAGGS